MSSMMYESFWTLSSSCFARFAYRAGKAAGVSLLSGSFIFLAISSPSGVKGLPLDLSAVRRPMVRTATGVAMPNTSPMRSLIRPAIVYC